MRKPNTKCCKCGRPVYRRPHELAVAKHIFCSVDCRRQHQKQIIVCPICQQQFTQKNHRQVCCSTACSNRNRTGVKYKRDGIRRYSASAERLKQLYDIFHFTSCMIEGCDYNKTYDIHRLIDGKRGGEYIIGNMFAICPNHHAEIHRGVIEIEKLSDCILRAIIKNDKAVVVQRLMNNQW